MIVDVEKVKEWLRVDGEQDDTTIDMLINASEEYLYNSTGLLFNSQDHLARLFILVLVTDWFENRELVGSKPSEKVRFTVQSILSQLQHNYDEQAPEAPSGLDYTISDGIATLSWKQRTEGNLGGYNVYQGGSKINQDGMITETQYPVTGLSQGYDYYFQVSAVSTRGNESDLSQTLKIRMEG